MKIFTVWCEYDMGWNFGDYNGLFATEEAMYKTLNNINWKCVDLTSWQEAKEEGLLTISTLEIE